MPSTSRQKAKARKTREMDMMSDMDNLDVMLGNGNNNLIERELAMLLKSLQSKGTLRLICTKGMIIGILPTKMIHSDKTMSDSPLRPFQMNSILGCPKRRSQ